MNIPRFIILFLCAAFAATGYGQTTLFGPLPIPTLSPAPTIESPTATDAKAMAEATAIRETVAGAIVTGEQKPEPALANLRKQTRVSGLKIDSDADFAYAAIDVGQRLIAANKPVEAEIFFQAAEKSLDTLVKRTADAQAQDKAQFLKKLSHLRGNYLNKAAQAKLDIEQAIILQPEDKLLQRQKEVLGHANADVGKSNAKG